MVYHHLKPGKGHGALSGRDSDRSGRFYEGDVELVRLQAQQRARKKDLVTAALRQIEGVVASLPVFTEGSLVIDTDTVTPVKVFEAAPAAITEEPAASAEAVHEATAHPGQEGLVDQILKNLLICRLICLVIASNPPSTLGDDLGRSR